MTLNLLGQSHAPDTYQLPPNLYLVQAKAIKVRNPKRDHNNGLYQKCVFEIQRVYVGPNSLKGKTCRLSNSTGIPYPISGILPELTLADGFIGEIQEDETGLWWVATKNGGLEIETNINTLKRHGLLWFPFRKVRHNRRAWDFNAKDTADRYQIGIAWAKALREIYHATNRCKRLRLLRHEALARDSLASRIAILVLGANELRDANMPFLAKLATRKELSILGQVTLDEVLAGANWKSWQSSKQRLKMLERWLSEPIPHPKQYRYIVDRFRSILHTDMLHRKDMDAGMLLPIFQRVLTSKCQWTRKRATHLSGLLGYLTSSTPEGKRLYSHFLIQLIRSSPYMNVRIRAVRVLHMGSHLDKKQMKLLETVEKNTGNKRLAKRLASHLSWLKKRQVEEKKERQ
jgi:hypothetical protein